VYSVNVSHRLVYNIADACVSPFYVFVFTCVFRLFACSMFNFFVSVGPCYVNVSKRRHQLLSTHTVF